MMKTQSKKKHLIVAGIAALLMASSLGLNINTIGVFLQPMANSLNVSMGAMSTHSMLISIGLACGAFIVPPALNYFNIRLLVLVSAIGLAATTVGMSFSTQVWMFNFLGFIRGVAASLSAIVPLQLLINNWFIAKHGLATSFVFSFSGVAGALFSPILASIVENQGWRMALVIKAGIFVLLSLPGLLIPYHLKPEEEGLTPYGADENGDSQSVDTVNKVLRKPFTFQSITFAITLTFGFLIPTITAIAQHLANIGIDFGFSAAIGALMISACMVGNIVFKLIIGAISDAFGIITAVVVMASGVIVGLVLLLIAQSNVVVLVGSLFVGAVYSMASVGISLTVKHIYSAMEFPKVFPMVNFIGSIGGAVAVSLYGFSYDLSGGYTLSLVVSIGVMILVIGLILIANRTSLATSKA